MATRNNPDRKVLRRAARLFLSAIDEKGLKRDMRRTPSRVADAWVDEILSGYRSDPARILRSTFAGREKGMVLVGEIPFVSVCVHHLLPFHGRAHVAYFPAGRLVGLSKIARVVDSLSRRLQIQERLTGQIVEALTAALKPAGVACRLEAEHLCMTARGARVKGAGVVTSAYSGSFGRSSVLRSEFLRMSGAPGDRPRRMTHRTGRPGKKTRSRSRRHRTGS